MSDGPWADYQAAPVAPPPPTLSAQPPTASFVGAATDPTLGTPTGAQAATQAQLVAAGGIDKTKDGGTARNPMGVSAAGGDVPAGAFYIDQSGLVKQAPATGAHFEPSAQPQASPDTSGPWNSFQTAPPPPKLSDAASPDSWGGSLKAFGSGVVSGLGGMADMAALGAPGGTGAQSLTNSIMGAFGQRGTPIPRFSDITDAMGGSYKPESTIQRYLKTIGEFAPNAAMGGEGIIPRIASVAAPAVMSQGARDVTGALGGDAGAQDIAGTIGGLAGGGLTSGVRAPIPLLSEADQGASNAIRTVLPIGDPDMDAVRANLAGGRLPVAAGAPGLTQLATNVVHNPGSGRVAIKEAVADRVAGEPDRVMDAVQAHLGVDPAAAMGNTNAIVDAGQAAAKPLFDAALDPSNPRGLTTPGLARLSAEPEVATAIATAKRLLGSNATAPGLQIDGDTGLQVLDPAAQQPVIEQQLTPEAWDVTRKMLNKSIALDPDGKMIDTGPTGVQNVLRQRWSQDLTGELAGDADGQGAAIPGYRHALDTAGDYLGTRQAFSNASGSLFNGPVSRFQTIWDGARNAQEQDAIRAALANDVMNQSNRGLLKSGSFKTPGVQAKLSIAFPDGAQGIIDQMENGAAERNEYGSLVGNSETAYRTAVNKAFDPPMKTGVTPQAIADWGLTAVAAPHAIPIKIMRTMADRATATKAPPLPWEDPQTNARLGELLSNAPKMSDFLDQMDAADAQPTATPYQRLFARAPRLALSGAIGAGGASGPAQAAPRR